MNVQQLLESSNQYKSIMEDSKKLSSKWEKSGLLEGIKTTTDKNTMAMLLENQAKQLVTEQSQTGTQAGGAGAYSGESWNGVALPLVRRIFGDIAAKEFVSVQPMNLPSGLVFYLDFKYGSNRAPFTSGGSLYGAGKFGYSMNSQSVSILAVTGATTWATFNNDAAYSSSFSTYKTLTVNLGSVSNYDANAVRSFFWTSGSVTAASILQAFTSTNGTTVTFVASASAITAGYTANAGGKASGSLQYTIQPTSTTRGDFEETATGNIAIPEINVQLKSESIVAKTRKLKAQ